MGTLMDESKIQQFYDTFRWFAQLFKDIYGLFTLISNHYKVQRPKIYYYKPESAGPLLLPDPYYWAFKLGKKSDWNVILVSVCCPADILKNEKLKEKITEPAVIVIANNLNIEAHHEPASYVLSNNPNSINKFDIETDGSFSGSYINTYRGGGAFKGFFVPLYAFSKQALEQRSKEKNTTLEQALNDTIDELIVKRLDRLLNESHPLSVHHNPEGK